MWYGFNAAGQPAFETFTKSQKIKNLERDNRITCLIEDGDAYDQLRGVELVGTATVTEDAEPLMEVARDVIRRYQDITDPEQTRRRSAQMLARKRSCVTINVKRIVSWDHTQARRHLLGHEWVASPAMGEMVEFPSNGGTASGYLAKPEQRAPASG